MNQELRLNCPANVGRGSKRWRLFATAAVMLAASQLTNVAAASPKSKPLVFERTIKIPDVPVAPYTDYLSLDLAGGRIFATPLAARAVAVLDLKKETVLKMLPAGSPRGTYYSPTSKRLFVADGESGDVKVFSGEDYSLVKKIPVAVGADVMIYDKTTNLIYVNNGGDEAGMDHALVSAIDVDRMEKVFDIPIATKSLEGAAIDSGKQLLYVNAEGGELAVVDLSKRQKIATWKLPSGHRNMGLALDASHNRLYVACRDSSMYGSIIVLDAASGRQIAILPIGGWADGIFLDQKRRRIYVSVGVGHIETYAIGDKDTYQRLPAVDTDILAKTSLYSPELDRFYVSVPHLGNFGSAAVMIYQPKP
jgi:DNA-binding beta-propeller fold protein YncE